MCLVCSGVRQEDLYDMTEEEFYQVKDESNVLLQCNGRDGNFLGIDNFQVGNMSIEVTDRVGKVIATTSDLMWHSPQANPVKSKTTNSTPYDLQLVYSKDAEYKGSYSGQLFRDRAIVVVQATVKAYADPVLLSQYSAFDRQIIHLVMSIRYAVYPIAWCGERSYPCSCFIC